MKVKVDKKICNGCTICNITCPEVFVIEEDGKAAAQNGEVPKQIEQICEEAVYECPANAISIEYESVYRMNGADRRSIKVPALR